MKRIRITLKWALLATLLTGCASLQDPGNRPTAVIRVDNTRASTSALIVDLVSTQGHRSRLGEVKLNEVKEFRIERHGLTGQYQLVGRYASDPVAVSQLFTLTGGDEVMWDLDRNVVWFMGNSGGG